MKSGVIVILANEETGSEKVRVLVKVIQFVSGRARTHTKASSHSPGTRSRKDRKGFWK